MDCRKHWPPYPPRETPSSPKSVDTCLHTWHNSRTTPKLTLFKHTDRAKQTCLIPRDHANPNADPRTQYIANLIGRMSPLLYTPCWSWRKQTGKGQQMYSTVWLQRSLKLLYQRSEDALAILVYLSGTGTTMDDLVRFLFLGSSSVVSLRSSGASVAC